MSISLSGSGRWHFVFPLTAWVTVVAASVWLYDGGAGSGDAVGIAQVKEYKVSPVDLGRLSSLSVVEGQRVRHGQVLAQFETELIRKDISIAEARLRQISSEARATGVSLDIGVLQSERNFESEVEAVMSDLQTAQSGFARDQAELNQVREELQTQRDLIRRGLTKADRAADLELRRAALEESVRSWPPRIEALGSRQQSVASRLNEWRHVHTGTPGGSSRETQLQPLQYKVREQQELIQLLQTRVRNATLVAASDALVSRILARSGDVLRPGDPVMMLVEAQPRQVIAYVEEGRASVLDPGTRITGRRRAKSREQFEGKVTATAGNVSQLPQRFWINPNIPSWGREVYVELTDSIHLDPGEALDITWRNSPATSSQQDAAIAHVVGAQ